MRPDSGVNWHATPNGLLRRMSVAMGMKKALASEGSGLRVAAYSGGASASFEVTRQPIVTGKRQELDVLVTRTDFVEKTCSFGVFARLPRGLAEQGAHVRELLRQELSEKLAGDFPAIVE